MKMFSAMTALSVFIVLLAAVQTVSAQTTCIVTGCVNGECLQPPLVPVAFCNCTTGFSTRDDPNVCEDIDECADYFKCGITVADRNYYPEGYPTWPGYPPFWPLVPAGRCVNTPGKFRCLCHPPFIPIRSYSFCARPAQNRNTTPSLRNTLSLLRLLNA